MVCVFLFKSFSVKPQNVNWDKADSLFGGKEYKSAATAYERCYYYASNFEDKNLALIKRSTCFKNINDLVNQEKTLLRVNFSTLNDSLLTLVQYEKALNFYLQKRYTEADELLRRVYSLNFNSINYKKSIFLHALVLNELFIYEEAKNKFIEFADVYITDSLDRSLFMNLINNTYSIKNIPSIKSISKARKLQRWIPGAGLFYAGYPGRAIGNIFLQLVSAGFIGYNIWQQNYFTASTGGIYMLSMFYVGGLNQTNELVPRKNYKISRSFNDTLKVKLSSFLNK